MVGLLLSYIFLNPVPAIDTTLAASVVTAAKLPGRLELVASPVSSIKLEEMQEAGINSPKDLSGFVPALHIPDYGASLTSTIYLRGFGSRMENPVIGLYIDDIPVLDKNCYDFDFLDIRSATMLRGPQGTLFGRNSMCGVLSLRTLSPAGHKGVIGSVEYSTAHSVRSNVSLYKGANAFTLGLRHTDGFFTNVSTGEKCDHYDGGSFRWKREKQVDRRLYLSNMLGVSASKEGGFAYGHFDGEKVSPVRYNDNGSYKRLSILEGLKARYGADRFTLDGIASVQVLSDAMEMDQDFTEASVFTLEQRQESAAGTLELILRPAVDNGKWSPTTGVFGFFKGNRMHAPVMFKEDGIQTLILDNANRNIPSDIGHLEIPDEEFPILSEFGIRTWNAALYHESVFHLGRWHLTAGIRLDYEGGGMDYCSEAGLHYRFVPTMAADKGFGISLEGSLGHSCMEVLPKMSVMYGVLEDALSVYGTFSKGYRAGGFNTQIFSDILQNRMMQGLMDDLGVHLDHPSVSVGVGNTEYLPEEAYNYEVGIRYMKDNGFKCEAGAYLMDGRNQQLTVFPPGLSTGRMMTNSGRTLSCGADFEAGLRLERFHAHIAYGWNHATFKEYHDGNSDYSGNRVPYSPAHTIYAGAGYAFGKRLSANLDIRGAGPLWWNEANTLREDMYLVLGGRISWSCGKFGAYLRGDNLALARYRTFYFKSVGNEFFQLSKPRLLSIGITFKP